MDQGIDVSANRGRVGGVIVDRQERLILTLLFFPSLELWIQKLLRRGLSM